MAPASTPTAGFNPEEVKAGILAELADLKETAQAFGLDAIKDGSWFTQFLRSCLGGYHERVMKQGGVDWLRAKYPGLPTDAIAGKLCELAEQTAALAGGISGAAASGAVLTAGVGIPAAVTAVMGEVLFTVRLQIRLVYDLHLLYGIPLDVSDPEDLIGIFAVIYGVKVAEMGGIGAKALGPEVMRAQLFRLIHGNTKVIQAAASRVLGPKIARSITQKAILKTAVPIVGTAISAGWNYASTHMMGERVRHDIRVRASLREETLRLKGRVGTNEPAEIAVLEGLMALALSDRSFDDKERLVYMTFLRELDLPPERLEELAQKIDADLPGVCSALGSIADSQSRESVARCFCLIACADGEIQDAERSILNQLLDALDHPELESELPELCDRFRAADGAMAKALNAIGDWTGQAGDRVGETVGWVKGLFSSKGEDKAEQNPDITFSETSEERSTEQVLKEMLLLDQLLAAEKITQEAYQKQWDGLVARLNATTG